MKKLILLFILFSVFCSCANRVVRQEFNSNKNIYVGWLDLKPNDFRKWGYPTKEEWIKDISDLNITGLQKFVQQYLKDFCVTGAKSNIDKQPTTGYIIQFSNTSIDQNNSIVVDVIIKDAMSGKILKRFAAYGTSFSMSFSMYSFTGRLNNSCYAIAYEIYQQITEQYKSK